MTKDELLLNAKSLSTEDRLDLVMDLWDTFDELDLGLSEAQKQDLDRRIAADDANDAPAEDWQDLREKLLRGEI